MTNDQFNTSKIQRSERLPREFYIRTDVVQIARDLLGKVIVTEFGGVRTAGRITETEAYRAPDDRACHAFGNRRTARTEVMFHEGGKAYIYICYGIHHLFNVVTAPEDTAHAVLVRAVEPLEGLDVMLERRERFTTYDRRPATDDLRLATDDLRPTTYDRRLTTDDRRLTTCDLRPATDDLRSVISGLRKLTVLTTGPGALAQALGLTTQWTGQSLLAPGSPVWIEDRGSLIPDSDIAEGKRVGVESAGESAEWPWRFWLKDCPFVKKAKRRDKADA